MASKKPLPFVTPIARVVQGSVYEPQPAERDGVVATYKSGKNAGQPRTDYFFRVAIPKGDEQHWRETEWGTIIWTAGHTGYGAGASRDGFVWKILDGDSHIPTQSGMIPCEQEGMPGHWVLAFTGSFAPQVVNADGSRVLTEVGVVYPGCLVQVAGNVVDNTPSKTPGVYLNYQCIAFSGHYDPITLTNVDPKSYGFGKNVKFPPGASKYPKESLAYTSGQPGETVPSYELQKPIPPAPPYRQILDAAPAKRMTPAANGISHADYIAQGWTDELLVQEGLMHA